MKKLKPLFILIFTICLLSTAGFWISAAATEDEETVDFLFVQYAESVTLADGKLTLTGIQPETLYFSDRPDRIVGRENTKKFVEYWWKEGTDSFANNPPNAVLAVMSEPVPLDLVVVLKEPVLEGDSLVYKVEVLDGPDSGKGEACALFIDVIGRPGGEIREEARQEVRQAGRQIARRIDRAL